MTEFKKNEKGQIRLSAKVKAFNKPFVKNPLFEGVNDDSRLVNRDKD